MGVHKVIVYVSFIFVLMIFLPCRCNPRISAYPRARGLGAQLGVHEVVLRVAFNSLLMKFLPC